MIGGEKRQQKEEFGKKIGIGEFRVIAINPSTQEIEEMLGITLSEENKSAEYLGERDGNTTLRLSFWLEEVNTGMKQPVNFFLEDKLRENKEGTKQQYINNIGQCRWSENKNSLPETFTKRGFREAHSGEEELYSFLKVWFGSLNLGKTDTDLSLDWKRLMKGNVKELRDQIDGQYCTNFLALLTVAVKEKEGEIKEYQNIYNKDFLPVFYMKYFRTVDYNDKQVIDRIRKKKPDDRKTYEWFVFRVTGEYGCKDNFHLGEIKDYNPDDFITASSKVIEEEDGSY